jgi:hypothetical protein
MTDADNPQPTEHFFRARIGEEEVARILTLISAPRHVRDRPRSDDLAGKFDAWFDGGALRYDTCATTYCFADGTSGTVFDGPKLWVLIKFGNRQQIEIIQDTISSDLDEVGDESGKEISFEGGNGSSIEEAVIVRGATSDLAATCAEFQWLTETFGQKGDAWEVVSNSHGTIGSRDIDTMVIRLSSCEQVIKYFDITESFRKP